MGSTPYSNGVTFRVWAPNASSVTVRGDFNGWGDTALVNEGASGNWSVDVPGALAGQQYRYYVNGNSLKRDPRSRRVTNSNGNSYIYDPAAFNWGSGSFTTPARKDAVIYQMHVGTFAGNNPPSTFDQAIAKLDHVRDLGINVIKLMPINEFAGNFSWGYNPADIFSVESSYGGPDAFKRFVRACHERGIAVLVDVVHNHYGPSDLSTWRFDGWFQNNLGGIYHYNDNRAYTAWGNTRPDFGRTEVRQFIRDQIFMFLEEYRVDGFRWDSIYNMINTDQGANTQGRSLVTDINWEMQQTYPEKIRIAEDNAFDFSMNFHSQWDVGYRWDLHGQVTTAADSSRNMNTVAGLLGNWAGIQRVVFSEAHDYIARNHSRSRIPSEIDSSNPTSIWARKRGLLAAGIVMTTPGMPMIFQGQEMHETLAFHDDTALRWNLTNTHAGIVRAYRDLIQARRNLRDGMQGLKGNGINVNHINNSGKVVSFIRWDQGGQVDDVVVVANFSATIWSNNNYAIQFPSAGTWYSHFNSDSTNYQSDFGNVGSIAVTAAGSPAIGNINIGMYGLQIFSKIPPGDAPPPPPPPPPVDANVAFNPEEPLGCVPVIITFDPAEGLLQNDTNIIIHLGKNGWQDVISVLMSGQSGGPWTATVQVEAVTAELNLAFHNGAGVWENNQTQNWNLPVSGCDGPSPPLVTTAPITDITTITAAGGGEVLEFGDAPITEQGVVWNTLPGPTITHSKHLAGIEEAVFTNLLTGLKPGRTYFARAYAMNSEGTGYGEEEIFTALCFTNNPEAMPASSVGLTYFTANWAALAGALGYQLDVSTNEHFMPEPGIVYRADFEGASETNTTYTVDTVSLGGMTWQMTQALIGTSGNDKKTGARSARIRRSGASAGEMVMTQDLTNGLGQFSFQYARFGSDIDHPSLYIEYSTNQGAEWNNIGTIIPPLPNALTTYSNTINVSGNIRVRFRTDTNGTNERRINIDDIVMAPYSPAIQSYVVAGSNRVVTGLSEGITYFYQVRALGADTCVSGRSSTQSVTTTSPALVFDPPEPIGCNDITITYYSTNRPLQDATNVILVIGRNGWQFVSEIPMNDNGNGVWSITVPVEVGTHEVNMALNNGEGIWDSNSDQDWHLPVSGCAIPPGMVEVSPPLPSGCTEITITYRQTNGVLQDAGLIQVELGHNDWLNIQTLSMSNVSDDIWTTTYQIPQGTWQLDFVFHDGQPTETRTWDNNDWMEWHVYVAGCLGTETIGVIITNPTSDTIVNYVDDAFDLSGIAMNMQGDLTWINETTGESGLITAGTNWNISAIALDLGANLIRVSGVNSPENPNDGTQDHATNALYTSGNAWITGQNGGQGWGDGWLLTATANSGHFLASTSSANLTISANGWGLWANSGGLSEAVRPFADNLRAGDVLTIHYENNWIDNGSTVGIGLKNALGENLFEFLFIGGGNTYLINDAETGRDTGIPWTGLGLTMTFELLTPTTYRFTAGGQEITGTLAPSSEALIRRFRAWNQSAGPGWERNVYVAGITINGLPLDSQEYQSERTILRKYGPHFDFKAGDEEQTWRLTFPFTEIGYIYDVQINTNLIEDGWTPLSLDQFGSGTPLHIPFTNGQDILNIRTSIRPIE